MTHDMRQPPALSPVQKFNQLADVFGNGRLARLMHTRASALQPFTAGVQPLGQRHTERLELLHDIVHDLEGSYNAIGINRWFDRPHKALGRQTPRQLMHTAWRAEQREIRHIRKLAKAMTATPAT